MEMTTEGLLLAESSTGRISTTCNQRVRAHYLMRYPYDFIYGDAIVTPLENSLTIFIQAFALLTFPAFSRILPSPTCY